MRILVTRPREQARELARELQRRGHDVLIEPLLTIEALSPPTPDPEGIQAVLLTSANAAHALRGQLLRLPVYAVGRASAQAARAAGCAQVHEAEGDAERLARLVIERRRPVDGALLHPSGEEVREELAETLAAHGFEVRRHVVYRARAATTFSPALEAVLRQRALDAVLFFSPRTASIFVALAKSHGLGGVLGASEALCLSENVAIACRALDWRRVLVAQRPERAAILELLEGAERRW